MGHDLSSKITELETYRDIVCRQVDILQAYFDSLTEGNYKSSRCVHVCVCARACVCLVHSCIIMETMSTQRSLPGDTL